MTSIQSKNQTLWEQLNRLIQDPYIKKCVGEPEIPICFVEMLEELLAADSTSPKTDLTLWSVASIFLQMGLEMHTKVSTERQLSAVELKMRQRFVLAGDYYSSLFYRLLADRHEISAIRYFSQVISSINQVKLLLHMQWIKQQTYDQEMIKNLKTVTSGLLMAVADFFHVQEDFLVHWKKTASMYLFIDYLERRKEWHHFSSAIRLQIKHEWNELIHLLETKNQQYREQRLFALLEQKIDFMNRLSAKES